MDDADLTISVVIPTKDRTVELMETLASLIAQKHHPLEVILVDDSVANDVCAVSKEMEPSFSEAGIEFIFITGAGKSLTQARNQGWVAARGDIVLFLDDDVSLDQGYIDAILDAFRDDAAVLGVQGLIVNAPFSRKQNLIRRIFAQSHYRTGSCIMLPSFKPVYPLDPEGRLPAQHLSGCNHAYRRHVMDEGGFDQNLIRYGMGEDMDLSFRVWSRHKGSLVLEPKARVRHMVSPSARLPGPAYVLMRSAYHRYLHAKNLGNDVQHRLQLWRSLSFYHLEALARLWSQRRELDPAIDALRTLMWAEGVCWRYRRELASCDVEGINRIILDAAENGIGRVQCRSSK